MTIGETLFKFDLLEHSHLVTGSNHILFSVYNQNNNRYLQ